MNNFARLEQIFLYLDAHWILEKAKEIALQMGVDLSSLSGWQQHLQHHHNIMSLHLEGEASTTTLFAGDHLENGRPNLKRYFHGGTSMCLYNLLQNQRHILTGKCYPGEK